MYYLETGFGKHERFRNAVILALVAHAAIIFSISFTIDSDESRARQIEVTLINRPDATAPDDARLVGRFRDDGSWLAATFWFGEKGNSSNIKLTAWPFSALASLMKSASIRGPGSLSCVALGPLQTQRLYTSRSSSIQASSGARQPACSMGRSRPRLR